MQLQLVRYCYGPDHVAGLLKFGENFSQSVWTLECPWAGNMVFTSCIPDGSYPLQGFDSPEHPGCWVITPVPGRTGILIHVGNTVKDTQGCILIGQQQGPGSVGNSRAALRQLNYTLDRKGQHTITLGSGLGAVLMHSGPENDVPSGGDPQQGPRGVPDNGGKGTDRTADSPGGTD